MNMQLLIEQKKEQDAERRLNRRSARPDAICGELAT